MKRQLILIFTIHLFPLIIFCQNLNQPVIDMHMHAYLDGFDIPNPNTGEILVRNTEEHRTNSLMLMEKNNVVLGAVSIVNENHEIMTQIFNAWEKDGGDKLLKGSPIREN